MNGRLSWKAGSVAGQTTNKQDQGGTDRSKADPTAVGQFVEQRVPKPPGAGLSPSRRDSDGGNGTGRPPTTGAGDGSSPEHVHHVSFGIYKHGQGYWVRMMTAVMAGIMFLSCAAWAWGQLE